MGKKARRRDHAYGLLIAELQRRIDRQSQRMASTESRANALIAASAIFAGLLVATPMTFDVLVALVINIAATGFGIATMFPRLADELAPSRIRMKLLTSEDADMYLVDRYLEFIEKREAAIGNRMALVKVGLVLMGISLVLAAIAISHGVGM